MSEAETRPSRRDLRASKRAQRDLIEGERDNSGRNRLLLIGAILIAVMFVSMIFNWYVNSVRTRAFREGQNNPNDQITQAICTEAYTVGVDGRAEPTAVAGARGSGLSTSGKYCVFSAISAPPTKPVSK